MCVITYLQHESGEKQVHKVIATGDHINDIPSTLILDEKQVMKGSQLVFQGSMYQEQRQSTIIDLLCDEKIDV